MVSEDNYWKRRLRDGRFTRRTFVGGAAAAGLGAASLGLVGCGSSSNNNKTPTGGKSATPGGSASAAASAGPSETPKAGGSYTEALTGVFAGVDPSTSVYGGSYIVPEVYSYLIRDEIAIHPQKGIIDDLAESHKVEADGVTWTFKLRPNVMIAANTRGVPVRALDSSDAKANWEKMADPQVGANAYAFANRWVDKYVTPDAQTFQMVMKDTFAWTEAYVGNNLLGPIAPKEWLENKDVKTAAVGSGPFMLTELVEGDHATMVKNPTYYKKARPYLDKIVIRLFSDQATYRTAFTAGQVDSYAATNQDEAKQIKNNQGNTQYFHSKSTGYDSFWMSVKSAPWSDPRVRRAVNLATNRSEYISLIGHEAGEPIGVLSYVFGPEYSLLGDDLKKVQPYDVGEAKKLFSAAGVKEFDFSYPTTSNVTDYVNIFVKQMGQAGVTAKGQPLQAGAWLAAYYTNKLTASLTLNQEYQTPNDALQFYHTGGITGNNHYDTGFSDPDVDKAIDGAATTMDEGQRKQKYIETQKLIFSKDPAFINFFGLYSDVLVAPAIKDYPAGLGSLGFAYQEDMWTTKA
ncbi:ABC transporter substrate-binding protein [bacterium]|nr:ABC transporter substrate-binding protein [bacterium]